MLYFALFLRCLSLQPTYEQTDTAHNCAFGSTLLMEVGYLPEEFKFTLFINGENLLDFDIPDYLPNIVFKNVTLSGKLITNYFGQMTAGNHKLKSSPPPIN